MTTSHFESLYDEICLQFKPILIEMNILYFKKQMKQKLKNKLKEFQKHKDIMKDSVRINN